MVWPAPFALAQDRAPGRRDMGERQRVGGGAGGDEIDRDFALKQLAEGALHAVGGLILAVGERVAIVGLPYRIEDRWGDGCGVVAGTMHASSRAPDRGGLTDPTGGAPLELL